MLEFNVKNQIIERMDDFKVVADSQNYLTAKFTFTEEWCGDIIAIFGNGTEFYNVILSDNTCTVPWEVIKAPFFTVSAVCGDRITANSVRVDVEKSGYVDGETPKPPTPDVYRQILSSTKAPYIGEDGNWFEWNSNEKAFVDTGVKAEGDIPQRGIDYWTEGDKEEIKQEVVPLIVTVYGTGVNNFSMDVTYKKLRDALDSKQEVILNHTRDGRTGYYHLYAYNGDQADFISVCDGVINHLSVSFFVEAVIYWRRTFELTGRKTETLSASSKHDYYPSAKAVVDYVDTKTGDIETALDNIEAIAKGRATGYVFDTVEDMNTWLADSDNVANLVLGDNLYIRATDVPDYWWDGTQAQQLETQKVDLAEYVKNTDYATLEKAGVVKVATSGNARGVKLGTDNILQIACAEKEDILGKASHNKPITPVNLEYAVQVCTNQDSKAELTEEQLKRPPSTQFMKDYSKSYTDEKVGDIETVLDNIIAIQNNLMGVSE